MSKENGEIVIVRNRCRVNNATGFGVLDAAQKRARAGGCPIQGEGSRVIITKEFGTLGADEEIATKLPTCQVCGLKPGSADFFYTTPNPDGSDDHLPLIK